VNRYSNQVPLVKHAKRGPVLGRVVEYAQRIGIDMVDLDSISQTVIYLACCQDITGQAVVVDSGYSAW
jgi:hypothetical protein